MDEVICWVVLSTEFMNDVFIMLYFYFRTFLYETIETVPGGVHTQDQELFSLQGHFFFGKICLPGHFRRVQNFHLRAYDSRPSDGFCWIRLRYALKL